MYISMYCKYCGKENSDDSKFCKNCGKSIAETPINTIIDNSMLSEESSNIMQNGTNNIKTNDINVLGVNNESVLANKVANNIISNIKMIGWAIVVWLVYLGSFYTYHLNDIKELKLDSYDSYWGESCYDPGSLSGGGDMNPAEIYKRLKFYRDNPGKYYYGFYEGYEDSRTTEVVPEEYKDDPLYQQAVEEANRNKQEFLDQINSCRKNGFEDDFKKHALWSGLFSFFFFVIGRYLILMFKWIDRNRTK